MDLAAVPTRTDRFTIRVIGDSTVFLSSQGDELHQTNALGTFIFGLIDGRRSLAGILTAICADYAVEEGVARQDLLTFVSTMEAKGLLAIGT